MDEIQPRRKEIPFSRDVTVIFDFHCETRTNELNILYKSTRLFFFR